MQRGHLAKLIILASSSSLLSIPVQAGITVYKEGDKYVKIGGRIQLQYHREDPDNGSATDEVIFRRLRPYIEGSLHPDWKGKFQWDMGKADGENELAIKDAYMQYKGFENMKLTIGNANFPFSREFLTSSKYQQLVERTFVGDHDFGTPDRNVGLHLTGHNSAETLTWGLSGAAASIDPDANKLDFDTPINKNDDFNEGWIFGGRVDFHPFGELKFSQGDFKGDTKATVGIAAFHWSNDDDNNTYTDAAGLSTSASRADIDTVTGFEVSGAFRAAGFSVDAQYNSFSVDTVDNTFTGGLFRNGSTDLDNWSIEGGYMLVPNQLELVAGYESQDADNYADSWDRTSVGANWFLHGHDIKVQLTYRMNENVNGVRDNDEDEIFLQGQYVF